MYEFPRLRGGNRLAGGSLRTVAAIFVRIQNGRVGIWFWCVSTFVYHVHLSRAAQGEPDSRRLSTYRRGDFCSHTSGTEGWGLGCDRFFLFFFTLKISPGLRGGHPLADESLLTITAILVRIQAERGSRDFILLCFNFFIP